MPLPAYNGKSVVDPWAAPQLDNAKGKSVIVTGGAAGFGEAFVRAFVKAGAFVTVGDVNDDGGHGLVSELGSNAQYVHCDVTSWDDQKALFQKAIAKSPHNSCDIVIANAGIVPPEDSVLKFEGVDSEEPAKPDLKTMNVNALSQLYTVKLAIHYFNKQPETDERDRCLLMTGSLAGYMDLPGALQYQMAKFGIRGVMRCLRDLLWLRNIRINIIAPWFVRTGAITDPFAEFLLSKGFAFAHTEDVATATMRLACDKSIAGCALAIVPEEMHPKRIFELKDDFAEDDILYDWQKMLRQAFAGVGAD